jgi:hypothetical protein
MRFKLALPLLLYPFWSGHAFFFVLTLMNMRASANHVLAWFRHPRSHHHFEDWLESATQNRSFQETYAFDHAYIYMLHRWGRKQSQPDTGKSPTIKREATRQQTKQKSKCRLAAQGYNNARTMDSLPVKLKRKQSWNQEQKEPKMNWPTSGAQTSPGIMCSSSSAQNLWSGLGHAADPAGARSRGVEARSSRKHAGQVEALYHQLLPVIVCGAGCALVAELGKGFAGGFGEELHGARAEPPQGLKRYRSECMPGAGVVRVVVPALVSVPKSGCVARGADRRTKVWSCEGMN